MFNKHLHWNDIGLAQMVDESTNIAILSCVNTKGICVLQKSRIVAHWRFGVHVVHVSVFFPKLSHLVVQIKQV